MAKPFVRGSSEYYKFTLTDRDAQDLTSDVVQVAIVQPGVAIADFDWLDCQWDTGEIWRTSATVDWSDYPAADYQYQGWAKVADSPETLIVDLGPVPIEEP